MRVKVLSIFQLIVLVVTVCNFIVLVQFHRLLQPTSSSTCFQQKCSDSRTHSVWLVNIAERLAAEELDISLRQKPNS